MAALKTAVKSMIQISKTLLLRKRIREERIPWEDLKIPQEDLVCFCLSTNPIYFVSKGGQSFYFRECPQTDTPEEFLKKRMDYFFRFIRNNDFARMNFSQEIPIRVDFPEETAASFRAYLNTLDWGAFWRRMRSVDRAMEQLGYSIWKGNPQLELEILRDLGLPGLQEQHREIGLYFLWQMRGAAMMSRQAGIVRGKNHSFFNASRAISSRVVAEALQLQELVTDVRWCRLQVGDLQLYGTLSPAAPGIRARDWMVPATPDLQRNLTDLHMLDLLCFQQDHGPDNYNVVFKENNTCVCAFDNDNPNTFFPIPGIGHRLAGCNSLLTRGGLINRRYLNRDTAQNVLELDQKALNGRLIPWLNPVQRFFFRSRVKAMQKAIEKTAGWNPAFLKDTADWTDVSVKEELDGLYGVTYLTKCCK